MKNAFLKITSIMVLVLVSGLSMLVRPGLAVVFCPDDREPMTMQTTLPWGAVGYMDNGCTATLIDPNHIAAAAHCFVSDDTGAWQPNLRFYPNFNPARANSPSVAIDRVVVGARVETGGEYMASDWGIGHLATPVSDFSSMRMGVTTAAPRDVRSVGYGREAHLLSPGPPPPGGVSKMGGNVWWQPALVDPACKIYDIDKDQLFFDCATIGGNSGSPIFYPSGNAYYLTGVIHGGPCFLYWHGWWRISAIQVSPGSPVTVASRGENNLDVFVVGQDGGIYTAAWGPQTNYEWQGWWRVLNLEAAPGSYVGAVSRSAGKLDIFVTGKDGGVYTAGWDPSFTDGWHGWWKISTIQVSPGSPVTVASRGPNNLDVFVTGQDGGIYTAAWGAQTGYEWQGWWRVLSLEAQTASYIGAVSRSAGKLDIVVTGKDGGVYTAGWDPSFTDGWHGWWRISTIQIPAGSPVTMAARGPNNLDVFVTGQDGGIYTAAWGAQTSYAWQGWSRVLNLVVQIGSYIDVVSRNADALDIFVTGMDNAVYGSAWESASGNWRYWCSIINQKAQSGIYIGAVSRNTDWLDIFTTGLDNEVYTASWNPGFTCENINGQTPAFDRLNAGPSASRFVYAPRFASNVALARYVDGSARTQVFATDSDSGLVVTRYSKGTQEINAFNPFSRLADVPKPRRIASLLQTNNKPQIIVTSDNGNLYTMAVKTDNSWGPLTTMEKPAAVTSFLDVDAAYDSEGTNQIYVIGDNKKLYTRQRINTQPDSPWAAWQLLGASAAYEKVSSIRRANGTQQLFLVTTTGGISTLWQTQATASSAWTQPGSFGSPSGAQIVDIDAAWTEDEAVQVFAVDTNGNLWIRSMVSQDPASGWGAWQSWSTTLYAPSAPSPQPPPFKITSLTASRWQEETAGDIVPVVFATDNQGNIYYTTHGHASGWSPWRSFYEGYVNEDYIQVFDQDNDGYSISGGDCNNADNTVNPGAVENCNDIDDDCDGLQNEQGALGCKEYYKDKDKDGYGVSGDKRCLCTPSSLLGYTALKGGDPDDQDPNTIGGAKTITINLYTGFNLFCLPLYPLQDAGGDPVDLTAKGLITQIPEGVQLFSWNNGTQSWSSVIKVGRTVIGNDFPIHYDHGYFIQMSAPTSYTFFGDEISTPVRLQLKAGFNLCRIFESPSSVFTSQTLINAIPGCRQVFGWNPSVQSWASLLKVGPRVIGATFDIEFQRGYFVQVDADATWP